MKLFNKHFYVSLLLAGFFLAHNAVWATSGTNPGTGSSIVIEDFNHNAQPNSQQSTTSLKR